MKQLKNTISIYLKFGNTKLRIPVNPEKIEIKYPGNHKEYDVLGIGQVVVQKRPGLQEVSWEGFFPGEDSQDPYINAGAKSPEWYEKQIRKAMKNRQKGRLIISRSGLYDTNIRCIVSEFETTDQGGEPGDMYYSISLQEYRDYSPQTVSIVTVSAPSSDGGAAQNDTIAEQQRVVETPVLRVGATVTVNGEYCYDSYGGKPHGTANNISTTVTRIVSGNPYPVHVGSYGWVQESQIQITG